MDFTKNLITDVYTAYAYLNGELIFTSKNLVGGDITNSSTSEDIRNGAGNGIWGTLDTDKDVQISLKENTFNYSTIAMLAGTEIITGAGEGYSSEVELTVSATKTITLPTVPKDGDTAVLNMQNNGLDVTGTLSGSEVSFVTGALEGDKIKVYPYKILTGVTTQTIKVNANEFPEGVVLVLKTKEVSSDKRVVADIEVVLPKTMITSDFKISTTSKVQANENEIKMKVAQYNDNGDLYYINRIPRV